MDALERAARRLARRGRCTQRVRPNRFCGRPIQMGELCPRHWERAVPLVHPTTDGT